ncbi:hypothetical protein K505DRAFT_366086 [Melanomma pulvis-pyrius CBS 109.77]|uniref:Uncharacterized protein n=1 Tax=Melanomma pulvis-pyrius CBS 109.77 TaxID=1314802 RepID=A0A6A6WYW1_9PLEO|nr:hypothetical protein K505DRAFT_366086 [Melanomma pulvis-pyrius CBS 109.77]
MSTQDKAAVDAQPYQFDDSGVPKLAFSNDQAAAHAYRRRSTMPPQLDPESDPTIVEVREAQERWISDMVQAVFNHDGVPEAVNLPAYTMFMHGSRTVVTGYDVEATCRLIFEQVIDRCRFGFRGPVRDNMALNPSNDCKDDRYGNCLTRITNVTHALRVSKCICRDIIFEDYNCIKLVNAPLKTLSRKKKQRQNTMVRAAAIKEAKDAKAVLKAAADMFPMDQDMELSLEALPAPNLTHDLFDFDMVNTGNEYFPVDDVVNSGLPFAFDHENYDLRAGTSAALGHENLDHDSKHSYMYGSPHMDLEDLIAGGYLSQEDLTMNPQDGQTQILSLTLGPGSEVPSPQPNGSFTGHYNIPF